MLARVEVRKKRFSFVFLIEIGSGKVSKEKKKERRDRFIDKQEGAGAEAFIDFL